MLKQDIAYVALNSFESDQTDKAWAKAFPEISKAGGIVLDLRLNGGGSSGVGYEILSYLVKKPFETSRVLMRSYVSTERAWGTLMDFKALPAGEIKPQQKANIQNLWLCSRDRQHSLPPKTSWLLGEIVGEERSSENRAAGVLDNRYFSNCQVAVQRGSAQSTTHFQTARSGSGKA
jgi:hypothetical protein